MWVIETLPESQAGRLRELWERADHRSPRLAKQTSGHTFCITQDGDLRASVRIRLSSDGSLSQPDALGLPSQLVGDAVSLTTDLVVEPPARTSAYLIRLARLAYAFALQSGSRINVALPTVRWVPFYARLGYRCHAREIHDDSGVLYPMMLDLHDLAYLEQVRSPLRGIARTCFGQDSHTAEDALGTPQRATRYVARIEQCIGASPMPGIRRRNNHV